ncbi:hypothetical protein I3842_03G095600 [Carya illinoinensis]|uniref:Uncharacterized protein n=1 Tax=Carya illinoinensis TaxID=32201 RepID=A0A922FJ12_CARIL|nr:hypothetical protein I3842_03G095600 [Carya illinoinensis]
MGFFREVGIDSKLFTLVKEGAQLRIIERSWKRQQELLVKQNILQWVCKALESCLSREKDEFYSSIREGSSSYLAQKCYNSRGRFLEVAEYKEGGGRRLIIFPEGDGGKGWKRLKEALGELLKEEKT